MTRRLQLVLCGIFFGLLLVYSGTFFYRTLAQLTMRSDPGWSVYQIDSRVVISQVNSATDSFPLRPLDEVIAINGHAIRSANQVIEAFHSIGPGEFYSILTNRNGQGQQFLLQARPIPLSAWTLQAAGTLIVPTIFLLTGLVVFLLKPYDKQAVLLALMFGMFLRAFAATSPWMSGEPLWLTLVMLAVHVASLFLWPVFFHFFLIFPEPSPLVRKTPRLEYYLYIPFLLTIFPYFATKNLMAAFSPRLAINFAASTSLIQAASMAIGVLYIAGGLLSLLVNFKEASLTSRRKMKVIVAGSIAGFLPMFLVFGLAVLFNIRHTNPTLSRWLTFIAFFSFPLFPLSFAYAIVRHKVIPVRLILRRGVRYLLVSRGFIIIQSVVVFSVLSFLLTGSRMDAIDRLGDRADIAVTMVATAIAIGVLTLVNQRVMPLIDRRFFRESYDAQQLLAELGQEMRTVATVPQILELAVAKIQDALHTENVTIFLRDVETGDYRCAISSRLAEDGASSSDINSSLALPTDGAIVEKLERSSSPLVVGVEGSRSLTAPLGQLEREMSGSRKQETEVLRRVRSALLLPVATKDQVPAILSLGPRLGDLPFSQEDRQLLMTVALQMAFAIQNAELVQQITEEERLRHELEIATRVQRRLFPECPPEMARLELSGVCHPARGVGGDYYDFIVLNDSMLGIAVADVAGKGISAALLMSTVQASLRSQAASVNGDLTRLVSSMNRLLHSSTDASSFATFFYAQFDERTGLLTYVNAGHNPPLLVRAAAAVKAQSAGQVVIKAGDARSRASDSDVEPGHINLLTKGGTVIGAFHNCTYEQETVQMQSGDALVAYTDGLTEAVDPFGKEFGEQRLRRIIAQSAHLPANELIEKIIGSVRAWCAETPPHDDLTLVVMKVK
jgi:sigma-B regulation protein RsbU (phosphoserine phosphatase)